MSKVKEKKSVQKQIKRGKRRQVNERDSYTPKRSIPNVSTMGKRRKDTPPIHSRDHAKKTKRRKENDKKRRNV